MGLTLYVWLPKAACGLMLPFCMPCCMGLFWKCETSKAFGLLLFCGLPWLYNAAMLGFIKFWAVASCMKTPLDEGCGHALMVGSGYSNGIWPVWMRALAGLGLTSDRRDLVKMFPQVDASIKARETSASRDNVLPHEREMPPLCMSPGHAPHD